MNAPFGELKLPAVELDHVRRWVGDGAPIQLQRALANVGATQTSAEQFPRFTHHYSEHVAELTTLYPAVAETLAELEEFGLARYFGTVIGGDSLPQRKPDAEPLLQAIAQLGGTPDQAALIGDSAVDLAIAIAAGIPGIIIPSGYGMEPP